MSAVSKGLCCFGEYVHAFTMTLTDTDMHTAAKATLWFTLGYAWFWSHGPVFVYWLICIVLPTCSMIWVFFFYHFLNKSYLFVSLSSQHVGPPPPPFFLLPSFLGPTPSYPSPWLSWRCTNLHPHCGAPSSNLCTLTIFLKKKYIYIYKEIYNDRHVY